MTTHSRPVTDYVSEYEAASYSAQRTHTEFEDLLSNPWADLEMVESVRRQRDAYTRRAVAAIRSCLEDGYEVAEFLAAGGHMLVSA